MAYIKNTINNVQGTSIDINDALEAGLLYEGVNHISQTNANLPFILDLRYYTQENLYADVIYSQDDENDIKIWFNNVELENAGDYVELLTMTSRILPNDASKRFTLSNFVSKELELTIHDIDLEDIQDQVKISIGTLINGSYDYIPIGVFNIQDTPVNNHDKYVIKLRDNRVKFDFNYNAQPLIESLGGTATKKQILDDICSQANVESAISSFDNEDDEVGIYDSTVSANRYIAYLAEQGGYIPTIDRDGKLKFVDLDNLYVWKVPLNLMSDDYKLGTPFEIKRVVYESGVIKYETSSDETLDTLYLDAANPYITSQEQIDNIFAKLNGFKIDSVTTNNFLGNPAIDPYDIIEVYGYYDNNDNFVDDKNVVVFRTLANMFYTFNGKHMQTIDTQIGVEARTENVSKNSEATFRKWATTSIDNVEAQVDIQAGKIDDANEDIAQLQINTNSISEQITNVTNDLQGQITTQEQTITATANALTIEQSKTTNLESEVTNLQNATENNNQQLSNLSNYIRYENGILTLGESNSNFKLELEGGVNGEIRFMGNGIPLGYFNRSRLYVGETVVFNKQIIAKKDDEENANYYWHVTDDGCLDLDYGGVEE